MASETFMNPRSSHPFTAHCKKSSSFSVLALLEAKS